MTIGTPGFQGARLLEAREARGLTGIALADSVGLTRAAISAYEKGAATPSPETFERLCDVLRLPSSFFMRSGTEKTISTVFYRSLASATKSARVRANRRFDWLTDLIVPYLTDLVSWPDVNLPSIRIPDAPLSMFTFEIDDVAYEIRDYWGLEDRPISNIVWLLENNGILISRGELASESLDSFSAWVDGRPAIYINSDSSSAVRERYDCAHELGHLILHKGISPAEYFARHREYEDQAHRFAGAFLMPHEPFLREIYTPTLNAFRALKPKWLASVGAMIHRCQDLGYIEGDGATSLWRAYSRQGWRKHEPLDDQLDFELPRVLSDSMRLVITETHQSPMDVLQRIPIAVSDVEDLTGLSRGELLGAASVVTVLRQTEPPSTMAGGPGDILPFRN